MKLPIAQPRPHRHTLWAATQLALVLICLLILPACEQLTPPWTTRSATVSDTSGHSPVAFVYTWYSNTGPGGLAGASAHDGTDVWRVAVGHANFPPIIVGDTVYACVRGQGNGTQDIVAVRIATGQLLWRAQLPAGKGFNYVINADTTTIVVDAGEKGLFAINPQDGSIRWQLPLFVERKPLVHADVVYALVSPQRFSLPSLNAYRASDGKLLWSVPQGTFNGRIELNSSAIFENVSTVGPAAFSLRDGRQLWTGEGGFIVAATNAAVFINDRDYHLEALSAQDGSRLWRTSISAGTYSVSYDVAPIVNNVLYIVSLSGLAAVRTTDGTLLWNHPILNSESVIVMKGVAYLLTSLSPYGSGPDQVVALNTATGALLWQKSVPGGQLLAEPVASDDVGGQ